MAIQSFYENVTGKDGQNQVLHFNPKPADVMLIGGRVLFMQKVAVSLLCCTIDRPLGGRIDGVPSGPLAEGDACVHCCGHILGVADFRGR